MKAQTPGKIYLADQRGVAETAAFRRYSTFNFGDYYQEHKQAMGNLYLVNEEMLAGTQSLITVIDQASHILIIPITGVVQVRIGQAELVTVDVGEIQVATVTAAHSIYLTNPYPAETIHFLQLGIKAEEPVDTVLGQLFHFDAINLESQLIPVVAASEMNEERQKLPFSLSLGQFAGRQEVNYRLQDARSLFFAFVISGAFEAEGRLLHEKDGLALWDIEEVELEALSNHALILVLELVPPV